MLPVLSLDIKVSLMFHFCKSEWQVAVLIISFVLLSFFIHCLIFGPCFPTIKQRCFQSDVVKFEFYLSCHTVSKILFDYHIHCIIPCSFILPFSSPNIKFPKQLNSETYSTTAAFRTKHMNEIKS